MKYWAVSQIVTPKFMLDGQTSILMNRPPVLSARFQCHYQPTRGRTTTYPWVITEIDYDGPSSDVSNLDSAEVVILPDPIIRINDISNPARARLRNFLNNNFGFSYIYLNQAGISITVPKVATDDFVTGTFTIQEIINRLLDHFQIRKPTGLEGLLDTTPVHNTEYTDDFATNPLTGGRMTELGDIAGTNWTYDSVNAEMDSDGNRETLRYDSSVGSVEMEAQCTFLQPSETGYPGPASRCRPGAVTCYFLEFESVGTGTLYYSKMVADVYTNFATDALTITDSVYITGRLATETVGAAVRQNAWRTNHTSTKPADPGWIGANDTPDATADDTAADRILDTDATRGGMQNNNNGNNFDWFKTRAVVDRFNYIPAHDQVAYSSGMIGRSWR